MNMHDRPARGRRRTLAALAMLVALPWVAQQAAGHQYWPPRPTVKTLDAKEVEGKDVYRVEVSFYLDHPPKGSFWESFTAFSTMGLNWCKAKAVLPAGWNTQDNRELRTGSMCRESPYYGSLGHDYPHRDSYAGETRKWTTPDAYSFSDDRYIFSINGWVRGAHHAGGNHTTLHLFTLDVPDGKNDLEDAN